MSYEVKARKVALCAVFIASVLAAPTVLAQSYYAMMDQYKHEVWRKSISGSMDSNSVLTKVGQWGWGPCYTVAVKGNYAFIGNGALLQVLDTSTPNSPQPVGQLLTHGPITRVVISGNYAYTLSPFRIIDISNPTSPTLVSTFLPSSVPLMTITVQGSYAYVGNFSGIVFIIDVSDPLQPKVVNPPASIILSGKLATSIVISGKYLYAVNYDGLTLDVFDVSDPTKPVSVSHLFYGDPGFALAVQGKYLYLGTTAIPRFQIYDISDSYNPRYVTGLNFNQPPAAISVVDTIAYLSVRDAGFAVVDVADTGNIHMIADIYGYYDSQSGDSIKALPMNQSITSTNAYLATEKGLWIVNIGKLPSLMSETFFSTALEAVKISTDSSNHAFLAELSAGLKILDYSNPSLPQILGQYTPDEAVRDVSAANNKAYLLCDRNLLILDVSTLATPKLIGRLEFPDTASGCMRLSGSTLYTARSSDKLYAIDVTDPSRPQISGVYPTRSNPIAISQYDHYLYVANSDTGIQIFDISYPAELRESGFVRINPLRGLCIADNKLLVTDVAIFSEYEINDPLSPTKRYSLSVPGGSLGNAEIGVNKNFAYLSNNQDFIILDISNPDSGRIVDLENADSLDIYAFGPVAVSNGVVLLGIADQGVLVLKNTLDAVVGEQPIVSKSFELFQNFPNPFNLSTLIKYRLLTLSRVILKVYDILGREVTTVVNGVQQAGNYVVPFDASKFSSGVYFYRIEAVGTDGKRFVSTKKMELLK